MNIYAQCCGLIIMLFLLFFYLRHRSVGLHAERIFLRNLGVSVICVVLDIVSVVLIYYRNFIPDLLVRFECRLYLVSLLWVGYLGLLYTCFNAIARKMYQKIVRVLGPVIVLFSLLILFLPIQYYQEGVVVYSYGASPSVTYAAAVVLVTTTLFMAFRGKNKLSLARRRTIQIWMGIWIVAAIIQFLVPRLLLVGFATSLGMMVLFFELENPEALVDRETGFFNAHAFFRYVEQKYSHEESFSFLLLSLQHYNNSQMQIKQIEHATLELVDYLRLFSNAKTFKNVEREFFLLFDSPEKMHKDFDLLRERFRSPWYADSQHKNTIYLEPVYMLLQDSAKLDSADELYYLTKYLKKHNLGIRGSQVIEIDDSAIMERRNRIRTEAAILEALDEDRVEVFYQPIYSTKCGCFESAEALVRIRNQDGSILPPGAFIGVAEETGLITRLGERVFEKTCQMISEYHPEQYGIDYVEVNLSVAQCEHKDLAEIYKEIMERYHVDPCHINLEITETASLAAKNILLQNMRSLIDYGVTFSLDDFGNGQSNLNYIVDMPVHLVKFDRDMTQAYFVNNRAKSVMAAVNKMIHEMNLKVVSEGVETKEQLEVLETLQVDYIQGYYFSKPLPQDEFLAFIQEKNVRE